MASAASVSAERRRAASRRRAAAEQMSGATRAHLFAIARTWLACAFRRSASLYLPEANFFRRGGAQSSGARVRRENDFSHRHCERRRSNPGQLAREIWIASPLSPRNDEHRRINVRRKLSAPQWRFPQRMTMKQWSALPYRERHAYLAQAQCTLLQYWRDCANARCRRARRCLVPHPCYWERKQAMAPAEWAKAEATCRPLRALLSLGSLKGSEGLWLF